MGQNTSLLLQKTLSGLDESGLQRIAAATARLALATIGQQSQQASGLKILLHGALGAGKTTWVRGFLRACGIRGRVKSPSFSIVESYQIPTQLGALEIHHLDFYRQANPLAWQGGGLRDLMTGKAIVLIEWPEHAQGLPEADIEIWISWHGEINGDGPRDLRIDMRARPEGLDWKPSLQQWITDVDRP